MSVWKNEGSPEFRLDKHVAFERGYPCRLLSIDGTKWCSALLEDISEGGAKLSVFGSPDDFNFDEFFLLLCNWATTHRRCARLWLNGQQIGVEFVRQKTPRSRARKQQPK